MRSLSRVMMSMGGYLTKMMSRARGGIFDEDPASGPGADSKGPQ